MTAWISTGTVSINNGATTLTGSGTSWSTAYTGYGIVLPDGRTYEVVSVTGAGAATIAPAYLGSSVSGGAYRMIPTQSFAGDLAEAVSTLVSQYGATKTAVDTGIVPSAGSAAAPTLRRADDSNTGLNLPGGDVAQIVTGGVVRITADANGNVGINTIGAQAMLDIKRTTAGNVLRLEQTAANSAAAAAFVSNSTGSSQVVSYIGSEAFTSGVMGVGTGTNHPLAFFASGVEGMRLVPGGILSHKSTNPSPWNPNLSVYQGANNWGAIYTDSGYYGGIGMVRNAYLDAASGNDWRRAVSGGTNSYRSTRYEQSGIAGDGYHAWYVSPAAGAGGSQITWLQAMTLDHTGTLMVGETGWGAHVLSKAYPNGAAVTLRNADTSGGSGAYSVLNLDAACGAGPGWYYMRAGNFQGYHFYILGTGDVKNTNNSYGSISDAKLKQDVTPAGSQWADVKALAAATVKYRLKADGDAGPVLMGFVAQDVEAISPGLVDSTPDFEEVQAPKLDDDGNPVLGDDGEPVMETLRQPTGTVTKSVKYSVAYMKAFKALGEALERIEQLEARLAAAGIP